MSRKRALIVGITGQVGSYLAEFLLAKGYRVHGVVRRTSRGPFENIGHIREKLDLSSGDIGDQGSMDSLVGRIKPTEVYNLAAQSFVQMSWEVPVYTGDVTALGVARLLEAVRRRSPKSRFYQASSSEMFGKADSAPQNERTRFHPCGPYAAAKVYGHHMTVAYREAYGLFACSGICYNHESPRRGLEYVTRKITHGVARIKLGLDQELRLGNLDARRDWGFAGDYVVAIWSMLQQKKPDDYVVATGKTHTVRDLVRHAFDAAGLDWRKHVVIDKRFLRPAEVTQLVGDASKARRKLKWKPRVTFRELVRMMVEADIRRLRSVSERP